MPWFCDILSIKNSLHCSLEKYRTEGPCCTVSSGTNENIIEQGYLHAWKSWLAPSAWVSVIRQYRNILEQTPQKAPHFFGQSEVYKKYQTMLITILLPCISWQPAGSYSVQKIKKLWYTKAFYCNNLPVCLTVFRWLQAVWDGKARSFIALVSAVKLTNLHISCQYF